MEPFVYDGEEFTDIEFADGVMKFIHSLVNITEENIKESIGEELNGRTRKEIKSKDGSLVKSLISRKNPNDIRKIAIETVEISGIKVSQKSMTEIKIVFIMNFSKKDSILIEGVKHVSTSHKR